MDIGRSTNCATCCISTFIGSSEKPLFPQHSQSCGRKISNLSTLSNPLRVFPRCPGCPPGFRFGVLSSSSAQECFFSDFLRRSPDGGFDQILLSRSLLTLSFSTCCFSSTMVLFNFSIVRACSMIMFTSCSGASFPRLSSSSF